MIYNQCLCNVIHIVTLLVVVVLQPITPPSLLHDSIMFEGPYLDRLLPRSFHSVACLRQLIFAAYFKLLQAVHSTCLISDMVFTLDSVYQHGERFTLL